MPGSIAKQAICSLTAFIVLMVMGTIVAYAQDYKEYGSGLVVTDAETYASIPERKRTRGVIQFDSIDLTNYFPPAGAQGSQGSCAAWAVGYGVRSYYMAAENNKALLAHQAVSPSFLFNQITPAAFDQNAACSGVTLSATLGLLENVGAVDLQSWAYDANTCRPNSTGQLLNEALQAKIPGYSVFSTPELKEPRRFKEVLASGHPIIVAMKIYKDEFYTYDQGVYESAFPTNGDIGYHGLVVAGYDDDKQAYLLYNSWGGHWGKDGKMWISYDTFHGQVIEAYVVEGLEPPPGVFETSLHELASLPGVSFPDDLFFFDTSTFEGESTTDNTSLDPPVDPSGKIDTRPSKEEGSSSPPLTFEDKLLAVREIADAVRCGDAQVVNKEGVLTLSGFAGPWERDRLVRMAKSVAPNTKIALQEMGWPACEVAMLLPADNTESNLQVIVDRLDDIQGERKTLANLEQGDHFRIVAIGSEGPTFLQVFYLQADQSAKELFRGEALQDQNGLYGISIGQERVGLKAAQPYGPEAIIILASDGAVIEGEAGMNVAELEFITRLEAGIMKIGKSGRPLATVIQQAQVMGQSSQALDNGAPISEVEVNSLALLEGAEKLQPETLPTYEILADGSTLPKFIQHADDIIFDLKGADLDDVHFHYRSASGLLDITERILMLATQQEGRLILSDVNWPEGAHRFRLSIRSGDEFEDVAIEFTIQNQAG